MYCMLLVRNIATLHVGQAIGGNLDLNAGNTTGDGNKIVGQEIVNKIVGQEIVNNNCKLTCSRESSN